MLFLESIHGKIHFFLKTQRTEIIRCSEKVFIISFNFAKAYLLILHSFVEISLHMKASVWSKTNLKSGGVGGAGADPPTYEMRIFFHMSLKLTEPSFNNFQLNGAKMF